MNTTDTKLSRFGLVSMLIISLLFAVQAPARSFAELKLSYEIELDKIRKSKSDEIDSLRSKYVAALERHKETPRKDGDLEAVLRYNEEIKAAKNTSKPLPPLAADSPPEMLAARQIYAKVLAGIERKSAEKLVAKADPIRTELEALITSLTRADDIEGAKAAKSYLEKLDADEEINAARDMIQNAPKGGLTRAAMRLRRSDDNIEVIVRYDSRGKVSMDSPVENTREKYSQKRTQLQTKAKTLGEFLGAKGFKVDPYVIYDQTFDGPNSGAFVLTDLIPKFRSRADGEIGMAFSLAKKPKNPHARVDSIMPSEPGSCSYMVTCRYYIPEENTSLVGFGFVHGIGVAIGNKMFNTKGQWTTEQRTGTASHPSPKLVMQLTGKKNLIANPSDEFIILGALRVEHVKFSAFICEEFGLNGEVSEKYNILKQPALAVNGEFVKPPK